MSFSQTPGPDFGSEGRGSGLNEGKDVVKVALIVRESAFDGFPVKWVVASRVQSSETSTINGFDLRSTRFRR